MRDAYGDKEMIERQFAKIREEQERRVWLFWLYAIRMQNLKYFDYKE